MFSKALSRTTVSVLGVVFVLSICIGLSGNIALADSQIPVPDECGNNSEFTTDFRLEDCKFKDKGKNPYFILEPGYQLVLEGEDDDVDAKVVITVLHDKKTIYLDGDGSKGKGRKIKTRVVEERESEWDDDEEEWVTVEISRNYFAICKQTNAVYYFGEWSRDCEDGFGENDVCTGDESTDGSWEAGVDGAMPGLIMPGTFLLGAKYFQEIAVNIEKPEESAIDRGEHVAMEENVEVPAGEWEDCVVVLDTNPAEDECCDEFYNTPQGNWEDECDVKTYCPGIGIVQDQDLELVDYGFVNKKGKPIKKKLKIK